MRLLLHLPVPEGLLICVDKRHTWKHVEHRDDHDKLLFLNHRWGVVLAGSVGFGGEGLANIDGFLCGKKPVGDFAIADTIARFFRTYPPPVAPPFTFPFSPTN